MDNLSTERECFHFGRIQEKLSTSFKTLGFATIFLTECWNGNQPVISIYMYQVPSCQSNPRRNPTFLPCLWIIPPCIIRATLHWPISLTFRVIPYKKQKKNLNVIKTTTLQSVCEILNYVQGLSLSWCSKINESRSCTLLTGFLYTERFPSNEW